MDQRIGELLSRIIPLTDHDVEEILHEQEATNQRFGDIALSLGMCKPEHVLRAWMHQLETRLERVSIEQMGVDAQSLVHLTPELAHRLKALPVRAIENDVLVAVAHVPSVDAIAALEACAGRRVKLVLTDEPQLLAAIDRYYPLPSRRPGEAA